MNSVLKSKDLSEMVYSILYKAESEPLEQKDLDKIRSLSIQRTGISGKQTDIDAKEIGRFTNLEHLIINGFEIDDELLEIINRLEKLRTIQLSRSNIKTQNTFSSLLEYEIFDRCEGLGPIVGNSKKIKIIGQNKSTLDLNTLGDLSQVEELDLNDLSVINISRVQQLPNINTLDLCGSNIDDSSSIARLPIKTRLDDEYLII